jgi:PAS domain S-box-containing protein
MNNQDKVNILIVDDYKENLVAMQTFLDSPEYNIILASSGEEALKKLLNEEIALILLDIKMPGLDGFETARYIKERERTRHIPIIFITGHSRDQKLIFDGYASGAVDYIFKPGDPVILRSKVSVFVDLYKKNKALQVAEEKYRGIIENAVEGIYQVSIEGRYISANPALAKILRCDAPSELLENVEVPKLYVNHKRHVEMLQLLSDFGYVTDFESELRCRDYSLIWVCENARALRNQNGELTGYEGFLVDITNRKKADQNLKKREMQLTAAQQLVHLGSWEWDIHLNIVTWSAELSRIIGIERGRIFSSHEEFLEYMHPEDRAAIKEMILKAVETRHPSNFEFRVLDEKGQTRLILAYVDVMIDGDGHVTGVIGTAQDITEQRHAEEKLRKSHEQFRSLSAHLQTVREEERTKIAREIHDELGQSLTAIKLEMSMAHKHISRMKSKVHKDALLEKTEHILKMIDSTIQTVKNISSELRPVYLDLGVIPAIEWQSQEFQNRTGIQCTFKCELDEELQLDRESSTVMFRILQEALTNVVRHAEAKQVFVDLSHENSHYVLKVMDNGRGIPESELNNPKSLGLLGMRERAGAVKGDVVINGGPKGGTTVTVRIPAQVH